MSYCLYDLTSFSGSIGKHGLEVDIVADVQKEAKVGFEMDGIFVDSSKEMVSIIELKCCNDLVKGGSAQCLVPNLSKGFKNGVRNIC